MRKSAMERLSETKKSQEDTEKDEEKKEKKRRRSGGEAIECLREKGETARDEGARILRNKGRKGGPEI